jgi:hypothetical protein
VVIVHHRQQLILMMAVFLQHKHNSTEQSPS